MANKIKKLASFSADAIESSLLSLSDDKRNVVEESIDFLLGKMVKPPKGKKETKKSKVSLKSC